jgi:Ca2+-binding RTX toxin-like protein
VKVRWEAVGLSDPSSRGRGSIRMRAIGTPGIDAGLQGSKRVARRCVAAALGCMALWAVLGASGAQAATNACRGSAARVSLGASLVSEPVIANSPGSPCATGSQQVTGIQPAGGLTLSDPKADTRTAAGVIAASSSVDSANLGAIPVTVGHVDSSQTVSCSGGKSVSSGSSTVDGLTIAGNPVNLIAGRSIDQTIAGVRVRTNQLTGATRQALVVDVGDTEVVLGEATASGDACSTLGDSSNGGFVQICPTGSTYDVSSNQCVIVVNSGGGSDGSGSQSEIVVGRPYSGPSGGSVMSLGEARELARSGKLPKSGCLNGKGPKYVVLGTSKRDHITGTNHNDRILGLGGADQIDAGRGNDCIDGGTGSDLLTGGEGNDRVYGEAGNDHVNGSSGSDRMWGGNGNDAINTGNGRDRVWAGAGNDIVNAATAGPASVIQGGSGRDIIRINHNERRHVHSAEKVYMIH